MSLYDELDRAVRSTYLGLNKKVIERQSALAYKLLTNARRDKKVGQTLTFDLWLERQPTGYYTPYGRYNTARKESTVQGTLQWKNAYGIVQIDGPTLRANNGVNIGALLRKNSLSALNPSDQDVLFSVIDEQMMRVVEDMRYMIGTSVYGDGSGAEGNELIGLKAIIDNSTSTYAGLDPASSAFPTDAVTSTAFWTPKLLSNSGTLRPISYELLGQMNPYIQRGGDNPEDVIAVMNNFLWTSFEILMEGRKVGVDSELERIGYKNIVWDGITFMKDERCPANKIYYLNLNHLWLQIRPSADFEFQGFSKPADMDAIVGDVILDIQMVSNDRHRLGLISDIKGITD